MSSLDYLDLCRLCLVKDRVSVPIFEGEGDVRQIFLKITACLPVKVNREDKLPKKICDDCVYKVELCYQFWQTTANAEKQLLQWLGQVNMEDKQGYNVLNPNGMKQPEQNNENRLDGTVMQQVSEHQNNMNMGMMDNMGLSMPMMMSSNAQQQITSVPMDNSGSSVQNVQPVAGPSTQTTHDQITQNQTDAPTQQEDEEESSEEEENSDDECDGDEGLPIKEESEEDPNNSRTIEPTTFVNVSLACDEAGPSGLQQQKIADMPEMVMPQTADVDPKTGGRWTTVRDGDIYRKVIVMHDGVAETTAKKSMRKCPTQRDRKKRMLLRTKKNFNREKELYTEKETVEELVNRGEIKSVEISPSEDTLQNEENKDVDQVLDEVRTACPFCLKHFGQEKYLKKHIVTSHQKRAYKCDKCRASCHTKQNLEKHRKSHSDDYFFECDICHLKYKRKITLKQHQVRAHSDAAAQFICDSCGQSFKVKVDLLVHIKRKHNTDVHICRYCGKSVTDLHSHEWKHKQRAEMASLKFSCHLCIKKFQNQTRLDNHLLLHKQGYKCPECDIVFISSRQLEYHKNRAHKPGTTCPICKKIFVSRGNKFYQHVLIHAGIRPYNCDICGEDFTQRSSLFRHRKNHPGPLPPYTSQVPIAGLAKNVLQKLLKL